MKHHATTSKLGRKSGPRQALLTHLMTALIIRGRIKTTLAKAKAVRPRVEKLLTRAKRPTLANQRLLIARLKNKLTVYRLIKEVAPKYQSRAGGYTRIVKLPARAGDASPMAFIELI